MSIYRFLTLLIILASACLTARAQDRGAITGTVTDPSGAAIANADVRLTNVARGGEVHVKTTAAGLYSMTGLIPGTYRVSVQAAGFRASSVAGLDIRIGESLRADIRLEVGDVSEHVEVSAQAAALNIDTSDIGTTVETKAILNLPLQVGGAVRDPLAFARLTPGFSGNTANSAVEYQTYYTINGSQSGSTQILVDGADVELTSVQSQAATGVGVEAVEEFKVMSSNFSAEYGRTTGGIINLSLKSGTNDLHVTAFDFLRNDKLDARGFFSATRAVNK